MVLQFDNDPEAFYHPDITMYPYVGHDNVLGGGGRHPADIVVPPQKNLYYGAGLENITALFSIPLVTLGLGIVLGYFIVPKVVAKLNK